MSRRFAAAVAIIVGAFLILEIVYAYRLPRVMDEFTGAHYVYLTSKLVPYRDFHPPKTVLAYYIQVPPVALIRGHWDAMTGMKIELAVLWAAVLAAAAAMLRREIDSRAVLAALAMTAVMSTFVERATEIRPDAIAAIFGLASLLALIRRKPGLAGLFCAASFCSTQKGIYFALAGGLALVATAIRDRTRQSLLDVMRYGIVSTVSVAAYFLFWMLMSSPDRVIHRVIFDKDIKAAALTELYVGMRAHFWTQTLVRNPVFYAVAFIGLLILIPRWSRRTLKVGLIVPYAIVLIPLCLWHKQPWPYFFVFLVPTLFVVIAVVMGELQWNRMLATIAVAAAILIPLMRLHVTLTRTVTAHQRAMVDTGERLLASGDTYLDGTNMLFRHEQASSEFTWIDATTLARFGSLSLAEVMTMIQHADAGRPKLVIWTYRIAGLPAPIQLYIDRRFLPLYGNLLFYGPAIRVPSFYVAFDGDYAINAPAAIDGVAVRDIVKLKRGTHTLSGAATARLKLLPPPGLKVDPEFATPRDLFPDIYNY
ncbi:MAG TPA: hypothetical protein VGS96_09430 [Thermoanaerobaculia bacterium]|nr:hypothetical protein [Thermoanaerobaculia bacterium]